MRITQRERFERRLRYWNPLDQHGMVRNDWLPRCFRLKRCVRCHDDVLGEPMWRFKDHDHNGSWSVYLCLTCAPHRQDALEYWKDEECRS